MIRIVIFNLLVAASCGYAILRGGAPERLTGWLLIGAGALTFVVGFHAEFQQVEVGVFVIDLILLFSLTAIAMKADRFWPIVLTALHLNSTAIHILKAWDPEIVSPTYAVMLAMWAYPELLILAVGALRHQRRLAQFGEDRSWSLALSHFSRETADVDQRESDAQTKAGSWGAFRRHRRIGGDQA